MRRRLTNEYIDGSDRQYLLKENTYSVEDTTNAINKLGRLEDILDDHGITSFKDLSDRLRILDILRDHPIYPSVSALFSDVDSHNRAVTTEDMKLTQSEFALIKRFFSPNSLNKKE